LERYRVMARNDPMVTLGYWLEERSTDPRAYAGTHEGSLVYNKAMVVPVQAAFDGLARRQLGSVLDTVRTSVKLSLTADSFSKR
ncbi:MAG: hypothetical protein JWO66_968, partial [Candidatus Eremiobacteraeota bacterium]|nr:hypothetical protein [Candidatus Eremiobacteraeota bacterium]